MWQPVHVPPLDADHPSGKESQRNALHDKLRARMGGMVAPLIDLVLPPACPLCRRPVGAKGGLCVDCWKGLRFIEEPWCARLGTPFTYDLGPGALSAAAVADPPLFERARAAVYYEGRVSDLVHAFKYADRTDLAAMMAAQMLRAGRELLIDCDALVPVPLHRWRLFKRRFNQAALLAREIARRSGRPVEPLWIARRRATRQQVGLTRQARADNMRAAFHVPEGAREVVKGKKLIIIDDVMTTGATVEAVARALRNAGAARLDVLTFARVVVE